MSLAMTVHERETFLAEVHVGVLSVNQDARGPLSIPVWYQYHPGGTLDLMTTSTSRKARLIERTGRFTLCTQIESPPYKYVTVEGPVTSTESPVDPDERKAMVYRYLGPARGDRYLAATADQPDDVVLRMTPETWLSVDYSKQFG
jgi:nitroimidazol reductase NimA-like FMN-containing flavoprotein (pyridoxamine 5'-phosphate oxidase superfamily)